MGLYWIRRSLKVNYGKWERCLALQKGIKVLNGEGYYTVEDLLDAAREEYDNMVDFADAEELLEMAAWVLSQPLSDAW